MNFIHVDYLVPVMVCGHHLVLCDPWYNTFPYLWFPANLGVGGCSSQYTRFHQSLFWCFCGGFFGQLWGVGGEHDIVVSVLVKTIQRGRRRVCCWFYFSFVCFFKCYSICCCLLGGGGGGLFSKAEMRFQVLGCLTQRRKTPTFKLQCSTRNIHI